jgi:DNA helicase IV
MGINMKDKWTTEELKKEISSKRTADKTWFLDLLDEDKQKAYEDNHLRALLSMLRAVYIAGEQEKIRSMQQELSVLRNGEEYTADSYASVNELNAKIEEAQKTIEGYRHFFEEPYFARMDATDSKEGYNVYYIGKKGDLNLGIVDWRAPLSRRYYQKSRRYFTINDYDYEVILRRAIRTAAGKVIEFSNENLNVRDYLTKEEIAERDAANVLDPYLRELIRARKDEESVRDIIETIQEKQFDLITRPEEENFIVQGCAGSGKTMVLLHRLSYLMYNNERLQPQDVLVITPSRSFNDFIDELSQVLELGKVPTYTLFDYFLEVLKRAGVDITDKVTGEREDERYLRYLYSPAYPADVKKTLAKVYDEIYGLFAAGECRAFAEQVLADCRTQTEAYTRIKNASLRLRRTVLGEIKETEEGTLRYTKPFREFMNNVLQMEDFLSFALEEGEKSQSYFYRQLRLFYKSAALVAKNAEGVVADALREIDELKETLRKEIKELKRYRYRVGGKEEYTYPERIEMREQLIAESDGVAAAVRTIGEKSGTFSEFFAVLQGQKSFRELGKCETTLDITRYFYRATVKKNKLAYGMKEKGLYKSDVYALLTVLAELGEPLIPRHSLVFVDEGQDISASEYALLKRINDRAAFNVYGDLKQNITPWRGIRDWAECNIEAVYTLNKNYRNTNQIVEFVSKYLETDIEPIGFDGEEVKRISVREIGAFFKDKKGLKAVIARPEHLEELKRSNYNVLSETGVISKKKVNLLTVYESKGLEFGCVAVYDGDMTENERYIAYTRALKELAVVAPLKTT